MILEQWNPIKGIESASFSRSSYILTTSNPIKGIERGFPTYFVSRSVLNPIKGIERSSTL